MKRWPLFLLCFIINSSKASQESVHQEGASLAEELKNKAVESTQVIAVS